ncbi:hypothetical protein LXL04_039048 [Taraxacum kok-saghyz]
MNENNLTENDISNSMEQSHTNTLDDISKPTWENIVDSPIIDYDSASMPSSKYKLKLKYWGIFRLSKKTFKKMYCFGSQKCIYIDTWSYNFSQLNAEVIKRYSSKSNPAISICYIDKYTPDQSFIELDSDEKFTNMLIMYENEKEVTIYVTTENNIGSNNLDFSTQLCDDRGEPHDEDDSDYLPSEESYYSHLSSDNEYEEMNDDVEVNSFTRNNQNMKVESKFENVTCFKRALNHYAIINEFDYFIQKSDPTRFTARCENLDCEWRIHASIMQDGVTFQVKKMVESHTCTRSNKGGNKRATQGWIANVITNKLKSDGDVSPTELKKWIMKTYNVDVPYLKVFRGKQQVHIDMYGKWEDSFLKLDEFREELLNRNQGSVVEIDFDIVGNKKCFKRFFICFLACSQGFLAGCRPYIALDACHLKGKFNGVLAAATGVDGNNSIFPVAYAVLESENTQSWTWFLESLRKSIGNPDGLVISSDMQKGLEVAMMNVYPNIEHRECIRHLSSNFKKHFHNDFRCQEGINGCKKMGRRYTRQSLNARLDDQEKIELKHQLSLKEDTSVRDVASMDTVKRHAKILHLKVWIQVKHPNLKEKVNDHDRLSVSYVLIGTDTEKHRLVVQISCTGTDTEKHRLVVQVETATAYMKKPDRWQHQKQVTWPQTVKNGKKNASIHTPSSAKIKISGCKSFTFAILVAILVWCSATHHTCNESRGSRQWKVLPERGSSVRGFNEDERRRSTNPLLSVDSLIEERKGKYDIMIQDWANMIFCRLTMVYMKFPLSYMNSINELETGRYLNLIGTLEQVADAGWSSHLKSISSLIKMFSSTCEVLLKSIEEGTASIKGDVDSTYET